MIILVARRRVRSPIMSLHSGVSLSHMVGFAIKEMIFANGLSDFLTDETWSA
jgi:hypothetical protein